MMAFYQAGSFWNDRSPISDIDLSWQIPGYRCPVCAQELITSYYNYPHLDPRDVLSKEDLSRLGPLIRKKASDDELLGIIMTLRQAWNIPVTAGTVFGPTKLKVTRPPKVDFHVLVGHVGLFCRRSGAEKLRSQGLTISWVPTPATGKYCEDADYVEIVIPVGGHERLPAGKTFCEACYRYSPGGSFPTVLAENELPSHPLPFFKTIEGGTIIFTKEFVDIAGKIGVTGFVEGDTLIPVKVQ